MDVSRNLCLVVKGTTMALLYWYFKACSLDLGVLRNCGPSLGDLFIK